MSTRRMVDAPTRMFHWLLALSFVGAYLTADGERWRLAHISLGYTMAGLLVFRVLWGLLGPRHVRLAVLGRKLQGWPTWLQGLKAGQPNGRQAQNLLLATCVVALLALITPLSLSGYGVYQDWTGEWLEDIHELLGNAMLALVLGHLALIALLSALRRQNLARPMVTGHADGSGPDVVQRNHGWLALLLLVAVVSFWGWQWQQAPVTTAAGAATGQRIFHDDGE